MNPLTPTPQPAPGKWQASAAAGRIVLVYALFAGLWLAFSDRVGHWLWNDPEPVTGVSALKDWLFVAATALLLYGLIERLLGQVRRAAQRELQALAESQHHQQLLTAMVNGSPDPIFVKDLAGRYLLINLETARITGKSMAQTLGHDDCDLFPVAQAERVQANDRRVMASNQTETFEETLATVDGERVFLATKGPLRDGNGQFIGLFGISHDITQRKSSEATLAFLARRSEALLALPGQAESRNEQEFMQHGQELAEQLTGSQISFIHLVHDDQETIELVTWSRSTLANYCTAAFASHYPVSRAGLWADALRQRAPVLINDYASALGKHGLPAGHARLDRLISVPVLEGGLVRMMSGVGNKPTPYTELDVETVRLIADTIWRIVRQRRAENALRESESFKQTILNSVTAEIAVLAPDGTILAVNEPWRRFALENGLEPGRCAPGTEVGANYLAVCQPILGGAPASATEARAGILAVLAGNLPSFSLEYPCDSPQQQRWFGMSVTPLLNAPQGGVVVSHTNITERKAQQQQLQLAAQVIAQGREGVTVTDARGNIIMANRAFTEITGYAEAEVLGQNPSILKSGQQNAAFYAGMWGALRTHGYWAGEIWNRQKSGTIYPEWLAISALRDNQGQTTHYVASFSDLSTTKAAENRIQWLSHFDPVTGLPNRTLLQSRAEQSIAMVQRAQAPLTLLMASIDNFSTINDTLGHQMGDMLLTQVSRRLRESVREQDTVAHLSGKEFVLVLPDTPPSGAGHLATELLRQLAEPYYVGDQETTLGASIGIASYPDNGNDFEQLLKAAEIAMHTAKAKAHEKFAFFCADMYAQVLARDTMTKALRHAMDRNQFELAYQPQVDLQTGQICGVEALLRWTHPELGSVSPAQFIPLAEDTGLIIAIGEWVLLRACRDIRHWLDKGIEVPHVAINVSALQFHDNDLVAQVKNALTQWQVDPALIYLEVTESALMTDVARTEALLGELKALGLKLSLDDFGTGYSSLSYLKRFPFDQVKIDQSFVRDITTSPSDVMLVKVIISMAHGFGMKVIAEGVETEAQCEMLRTSICDEIQGYFFSRPISAAAIEELFAKGHQLPAHLLRLQQPQRTLLLVDDEPSIVSALKRLLRRDGHVILTANSGAEGLEVLSRHKVDVILSDQRMPGMTGVEFLRKAKANYPDTIRIVLSGYTELQSVTDAINEGAVYRFLTKPWDDEALREQINKAMAYKQVLEENRQLDIKVRTSNQELVAANRQLGDVLRQNREQIEHDEARLSIAREALQFISLPVLAIDDQGLIIFANTSAEELFAHAMPLVGALLASALSFIQSAVSAAPAGGSCALQITDASYQVRWRNMRINTRLRGTMITLSRNEATRQDLP